MTEHKVLNTPAQAWRARAMGSAATDIDLAFDMRDRPGTVTALLAACVADPQGRSVDQDEAWDWTLNQRLQALIAMRLASGGPVIELQSPCAQCGEAMEIALDLRALAADPVAPRFAWRNEDGLEFNLRLPQGRDLRRWMQDGEYSREELAASLIETVAGQPPVSLMPDALLAKLDDAFETHDPLTALRLQTRCPSCAHDNAIACDLEALLLEGFARTQADMLDDMARLAMAFHWSEAEILALPPWRRAYYLGRLRALRYDTGERA